MGKNLPILRFGCRVVDSVTLAAQFSLYMQVLSSSFLGGKFLDRFLVDLIIRCCKQVRARYHRNVNS